MSRAQNFPHRRLVLCLLTLLFLPISGLAAECDDLDIQITTTPVFPQFTLGLHQHFEQMRQVPTGPIDLLLVGDSLVWGWDPHAWGKGGEGKSIWGFGAVGDRTQNVLWRLQGDDLKKLAPKNVLLLIGTNNLGAVDKPCAVLAGFEAIVHRMRELWSPFRLLIVLIPPRGENWEFLDRERSIINNELQRRSNLEDWNVIDADSVLTCGFKQPCENYNSDFLHLSSAGYRELSSLVARALGWAN
jgi:lysophospholipase L1-like esterase